MDALALQLETDARDGRDWSPVSAYRADGTLGNTGQEIFVRTTRTGEHPSLPSPGTTPWEQGLKKYTIKYLPVSEPLYKICLSCLRALLALFVYLTPNDLSSKLRNYSTNLSLREGERAPLIVQFV